MSELRVERKENMAGGKGHVIIKHILEDKELNGKCKMYAEVTLEPGCSLGYHEHHNESETYYILRGEGNYDDNGCSGAAGADCDFKSRCTRWSELSFRYLRCSYITDR